MGKGRLWAGVAAAIGVYVGLRLGFPREGLVKVLNGLFMGTALVVLLVFGRLVWRGLTQPRMDRVTAMVLSFVLSLVGSLLIRGWSIWWRASHDVGPASARTELLPIGIYLMVLSGMLAIAATGMDGDGALRHHRKLFILALVLGVVITLLLSFVQGV